MTEIPAFTQDQLLAISKALGNTAEGLTGTEIARFLEACGVRDVSPQSSKWIRVYNALVSHQNTTRTGRHVVGFIQKSMKPALWTERKHQFNALRSRLNLALAFCGLTLEEGGTLARVDAARTISEAQVRADTLRVALQERHVHDDVLRHCRAELLDKNYFHAVLEAVKSVAAKIRQLSGETTDGAALVTAVFGSEKPKMAINPLHTDTDKSEQRGFVNLLVGVFGMFRNPPAHAAKIEWPMGEQDALDVLSLVSLVHRKLDTVRRCSP